MVRVQQTNPGGKMRSFKFKNTVSMSFLVTAGVAAALFAGIRMNGMGVAMAGSAPHPVDQAVTAPLPGPGTYVIDPDHSFAFFSAWHHIVGRVRGRFDKVTGFITVGNTPADCSLNVTIATATIDTGITQRDDDLRSDAFFDVKKYPAMTYAGKGIRKTPQGTWVMDGTLTIRGVARPVPLTFTYEGLFPDTPAGQPPRVSFHASAAVHRGDFGMVRDNLMELGPNPAGPDVDIDISTEADEAPPGK
jgi:polyisoprenoid-binding protein YceI